VESLDQFEETHAATSVSLGEVLELIIIIEAADRLDEAVLSSKGYINAAKKYREIRGKENHK
jgi:hypothetical protein